MKDHLRQKKLNKHFVERVKGSEIFACFASDELSIPEENMNLKIVE